jgi:hypothetical protein
MIPRDSRLTRHPSCLTSGVHLSRWWLHLHSPAPDGIFRDAGADRACRADQGRIAAVIQVGNRDYKFCVGTRRSSRKGRFAGRGCLTAFCRKRIAIAINPLWLRAAGIRSPTRARHRGGLPGSLKAIGAAGHGTRSGQRQRHRPAIATATTGSAATPGGAVTLRDFSTRDCNSRC